MPASPILHNGCLAYIDSFMSGLVPCRVLSIKKDVVTTVARVRVTADRIGYRKGEELNLRTSIVVPRPALRTTKLGQFRIRPYTVAVDVVEERGCNTNEPRRMARRPGDPEPAKPAKIFIQG